MASILDVKLGIEICLNCPYYDCVATDDAICYPLRHISRNARAVDDRLKRIDNLLSEHGSLSTNQLKEKVFGLTNNHINYMIRVGKLEVVKVKSRLRIVGVNI
jgi:hypothetical protein